MKQNQLFNISIFLFVLAAGTPSCKKYVDAGTPVNQLTPDKVYSDSLATLGSVLALYNNSPILGSTSALTSSGVIPNVAQYAAMSADDGYYYNNATYDPYRTNTLSAGNQGTPVFNGFYQNIFYANASIESIPSSTAYGSAFKTQMVGECKFWRAYCYFNLVNFFGDVPLTLSTDVNTNAKLAKTESAKIYDQIIADLTDAKNMVSAAYPSTERARVNKAAVSALLARVYLYKQRWADAEAEASSIISNSATYFLEPDLNKVFLKTSSEVIWQIISPVSAGITGVTKMGNFWIPAGTVPLFVLYDTLAKTFEANDKRKTNWTVPMVYNGSTFYYPFKYKIKNISVSGNEYYVMFRLAEQYLIRAEARAQQNKLSGVNSAESDINAVRQRAGLGNVSIATKEAAMTVLEHERWVELFTEMGDRWFNLKRTGRIDAVMALTKSQWQPFQALYPIPLVDRTANPNLLDNPKY